jgi:transposase-like protein
MEKQIHLFRAVDSYGQTVEFLLVRTRDRETAKLFLRKALANPHYSLTIFSRPQALVMISSITGVFASA